MVALQIEYSLLERTVEAELVPMAQELGLGITPWSPLKSGALSGKYTRANAGVQKADRGMWVESALDERAYALVDALTAIGRELDTSPARVDLAWVQGRPGVTSTIIGARTVEQLDQNLGALDVVILPAQLATLDALSTPQLPFPAAMLSRAGSFMHGGNQVNGDDAPPSPFLPTADSKRY